MAITYNYNESQSILQKHMEEIKHDLIAKYRELGMKASGQWEESLEVKVERLSGTILGEPYTEQLVNGRAPGKFPPISAIRQWVIDKGINYYGKQSTLNSIAFLVARKIAQEGTRYFQQGGTDLVSSVITPQRIQRIIDEVTFFHINQFTSDITGFLEQMKAA